VNWRGLRRGQLDLGACEVRVNAPAPEMDDGRLTDGAPKSRAGTRTAAFPAGLVPEHTGHRERFADPKPNGLVFTGPEGGRLRRSNREALAFGKAVYHGPRPHRRRPGRARGHV
jgi:hypothetical protein